MTSADAGLRLAVTERDASLADHYRVAAGIRRFEQLLLDQFALGRIGGTTHTCIGQEITAVGIMAATDLKISNPEMVRQAVVFLGRTAKTFEEVRMAIAGLEALKRPCRVRLYSDSQYLRDGITKWIHGWKRRDWRTADKQPVKLAALEGLETTQRGAPIHVLGWFTDDEIKFGIRVPKALSFLAFHDFNARVQGLDAVPPDDRPPVNVATRARTSGVAAGPWIPAASESAMAWAIADSASSRESAASAGSGTQMSRPDGRGSCQCNVAIRAASAASATEPARTRPESRA